MKIVFLYLLPILIVTHFSFIDSISMLNRRHIRIKVLQILYAFFHSESDDLLKCEKELEKSIQHTQSLYAHLLMLLVDLKSLAKAKIEKGRNKLLPSQDDLNPNTKFIDNKILSLLKQNLDQVDKSNLEPNYWLGHTDTQIKLLGQIQASELYRAYMDKSSHSFIDDRKFILNIFNEFIAPNEDLHSFLGEKSIYWLDDFSIVNLSLIKTLKSFKEDKLEQKMFMPLFKNEDDKKYAFSLLKKTIVNSKDYKNYIGETASNWDEERISSMDQLLMQMAICELLNFETIPVKVTLNEYIELSKDYSSFKSKVFINGVIDKLAVRFKKEKKIKKLGRGLVE